MRIMQITTELRPAGAERIVSELARGLKKAGHELMVVSLAPFPDESLILDELRAAMIPMASLGLSAWSIPGIFKLRGLIKGFRPDIVHSHLFHGNLAAKLNSFGRSYKFVNTVHIAEKRTGKWWHFMLDRLTNRFSDRITCVSSAVRDFYSKKTSSDKSLIDIIYNGISVPVPLSMDEVSGLRKEWGVEKCSRLIGSAGRLAHQKGYDRLFLALPALSEKIPKGENWAVVIIGEGSERASLEKLLNNVPSNITVKLPGFRSDAARCMGAFDLFVMPSRYEGFGLTLAEAMAHGIPVLASDVDSLPELISDYPQGRAISFASNNAREVAGALSEMVSLPSGAPCIKFSIEKMLEGYSNIYRDLLK
ncbi:MAG: hypothetical protein A2020_01565 [Lentisphaerae bacterium GWF2_45_14]|nr:MAG: hypothetical protein A2020_01565 [Lentisphaerae bacterium GWF2_45_14]